MIKSDLHLVLIVMRIAMSKEISPEEAIEIIGDKMLRAMRPKRKRLFVSPSLRPSRNPEFDIHSIVMKVKAVCRFSPCDDTVHTLKYIKRYMEESPWEVSLQRTSLLFCHLEESLLIALSFQFTLTSHINQTMDELTGMMFLLFSRTSQETHTLTDQLVSILAQLVFDFRLPNRGHHEYYTLFTCITGINTSKKLLSRTTLKSIKIILVQEVLKFHIDIMSYYCSKYDVPKMKVAKHLGLACTLIHGENDVIEFLCSREW